MSFLRDAVGRLETRQAPITRGTLYEGVVEYTADPQNCGRVKVRVAGVHDPKREVAPTELLPWFYPCFMPGSFVPPLVGETVLVMFRKGHVFSGVYLGVIYGVLDEQHPRGRMPFLEEPKPINTEEGVASVGSYSVPAANNTLAYNQPVGNESPEESFLKRKYNEPLVRVYAKTMRGNTIYMNDESESECLKIVDRAGQILDFQCPVTDEENAGNKNRRGVREATSGGVVNPKLAKDDKFQVTLMDARRQYLRLKAKSSGASAELRGVPESEISGSLTINEGGEVKLKSDLKAFMRLDENVLIEDKPTFGPRGDYVELKRGKIELRNQAGAYILLDEGGNITISAPGIVTITGIQIYLN